MNFWPRLSLLMLMLVAVSPARLAAQTMLPWEKHEAERAASTNTPAYEEPGEDYDPNKHGTTTNNTTSAPQQQNTYDSGYNALRNNGSGNTQPRNNTATQPSAQQPQQTQQYQQQYQQRQTYQQTYQQPTAPQLQYQQPQYQQPSQQQYDYRQQDTQGYQQPQYQPPQTAYQPPSSYGPGRPYAPPAVDDGAGEREYSYAAPPPPADDDTYSDDEILDAGHRFFGKTTKGLAKVIAHLFESQGRPNAYILGEEGGGALVAGLRYGEGTMYTKMGERRRVYWQGPSIGYDFGAAGSKTLILVYNLRDVDQIYHRYGGVDGSAYLVGGVGVTMQKRGRVVLAPIRTGVGVRLGANVGYLKYTRRPTWNPF